MNWIARRTSVLRQWINKWVSNIASEDISFVDIPICLFTRRLWPQSLAAGTSLEINIAGFMYIQARCCCLPLHYLRHPLTFSFFFPSRSPSCHISEKLVAQAWNWCDEKQLGYLYEPICFAVMASLALLSMALGFLLRLGAYCKLASSYLRLPAKCIADLTPCQAHPSWNQLHAQLQPRLCVSDAGLSLVCLACLKSSSLCYVLTESIILKPGGEFLSYYWLP